MKGFDRATDKIMPRLVISVEGREKHGKSHFALTGPAPIAVFNRDMGLEGVVQKFVDEKTVWVRSYGFLEEEADAATATWEANKAHYLKCLQDPDLRTIVWDTAGDMWELCRLARFGKLTQVQPWNYGPVNAEFRGMINAAYDHGKNLILLHKMKKEYVGGGKDATWNGKYERAGFSTIGNLVQINVRAGRDVIPEDERESDDDLGFYLYVRDCRQNAALAGTRLEGPMCNFPFLAMGVFPDSDMEEWE